MSLECFALMPTLCVRETNAFPHSNDCVSNRIRCVLCSCRLSIVTKWHLFNSYRHHFRRSKVMCKSCICGRWTSQCLSLFLMAARACVSAEQCMLMLTMPSQSSCKWLPFNLIGERKTKEAAQWACSVFTAEWRDMHLCICRRRLRVPSRVENANQLDSDIFIKFYQMEHPKRNRKYQTQHWIVVLKSGAERSRLECSVCLCQPQLRSHTKAVNSIETINAIHHWLRPNVSSVMVRWA